VTAPGPVSADGQGPPGSGDGRTGPVYTDLESWVHEILAQVVRRRLGGHLTWCPEWYRHAEAIMRLMAMWEEWEHAVEEGTMSNWWLDHCDPHMAVLMSRDNGPFMACTEKEHRPLGPLPLAPRNPQMWRNSVFTGAEDGR
jgi:Domain of unknown function (DUF4913)